MPGLADLNAAIDTLDTAKANVAAKATALIASVGNPIPQAVLNRIGVDSADLNALADTIAAATPPPAP